jgi:hypothetical protein
LRLHDAQDELKTFSAADGEIRTCRPGSTQLVIVGCVNDHADSTDDVPLLSAMITPPGSAPDPRLIENKHEILTIVFRVAPRS